MILLLQILFWTASFSILHTYVFYPLILKLLTADQILDHQQYDTDELPFVSIIIAAYNEELVMRDKLQSIIESTYDSDKLEILVGSDGSTDATDNIVDEFSQLYPFIKLHRFVRSGKSTVLNELTPRSKAELVVYTDANVIFAKNTLMKLMTGFKEDEIGLIGANITSNEYQDLGISYQEDKYIQRENRIKYREGVLWGAMMGAFGGCYAIRKNLISPIPSHFIVDDFYLSMNVLLQNKKAILAPEAICYEEVSIKESEEFRRKVRMSSGNFQNLNHFFFKIWKCKPAIGFSFVSHKMLRWLTPIFLLTTLVTTYFLQLFHFIYQWAFYAQLLLLLFPIVNFALNKVHVKSKFIQFIAYFYSMNLALFIGMIKFFSGIRSAVWEPTERKPGSR